MAGVPLGRSPLQQWGGNSALRVPIKDLKACSLSGQGAPLLSSLSQNWLFLFTTNTSISQRTAKACSKTQM